MKKLSVLFALLAVAMFAKGQNDMTISAVTGVYQIPEDVVSDYGKASTPALIVKYAGPITDYVNFQCDVTLPSGIGFDGAEWVDWYDVFVPVLTYFGRQHTCAETVQTSNPAENVYRIIIFNPANSYKDSEGKDRQYTFSESAEEDYFMIIPLNISSELPAGDYPITISDIVISGENSLESKPAGVTVNYTVASAETTVTLKITEAQYSTLILPFDADLPEGLKASTVEWPETGNELVETEVTDGKLKAGVPYLMFGEEVKTYTFTGVPTYAEETGTAGAMVGVLAESTVPAGCYVLQNQDGKVAFYKITKERAFHANRCYMTAKPNGANMYRIGGPTGIDEVTVEEAGDVYDMLGRKVIGPLEKGVYIKNNRKIYVK